MDHCSEKTFTLSARFTRRHLIGASIGASVLAGSSRFGKDVFADEGLTIVATIGQIADPVANIVGEHGAVSGLMGPGIDPHLYSPTVGDVRSLESADVILYGGLDLEGRMGDTLTHLSRQGTRVLAISETVDTELFIQEGENAFDPHLWFDVTLWTEALSSIVPVLIETESNHEIATAFENNWNTYAQELAHLDEYVVDKVNQIPEDQRVLVTAHDAFGYFGSRYGFEVYGIQGMNTASEASAGDIQTLADFLTEHQIPAIFVETSIPPSTIEALQKATESRGWDVSIGGELFSDAMGEEGTPEGTYIGMIKHNIDTISSALT